MNRYYVTGQLTSDNHKSYCSLDSLQVSEANSQLTQLFPKNLFICHNWLGCVGGVPPPDVQLYAGHGDEVEQDHQRPRVELVQRQQSRGETFFSSNVSMSLVPIFPSVIFPTVILSPSLGRAEAELRDLKAWLVGYRWRLCVYCENQR